jgi:hypothetical protein
MATCWFCERRPADDSFKVHMARRGETVARGVSTKLVRQMVVTISIPRCTRCADIHRWTNRMRLVYQLAWGVIAFLLLVMVLVVFGPRVDFSNNESMGILSPATLFECRLARLNGLNGRQKEACKGLWMR